MGRTAAPHALLQGAGHLLHAVAIEVDQSLSDTGRRPG